MNYEKTNKGLAVVAIALFNFIFLGSEYLFDNMMAYVTDAHVVVLAQSYILGASVIGFVLAPFIIRSVKETAGRVLLLAGAVIGVACIFIVQQHASYSMILIAGIILFVLLGVAGSWVHFVASRVIGNGRHLAKMMGIAYALGISIQFINNNCVKTDMAQSVILSVLAMVFLIIMMKLDDAQKTAIQEEKINEKRGSIKKPAVMAGALTVCVILMTCVFSTLDNAVTLVHATGSVDIGQWPRLLLALSGLLAGYLYDLKERRYMYIMMYCVTMLSTICVVVIEMGGPFLAGLIAFYLSAGFFVIFFTVSFMDLSYSMQIPELWAGFGRATNNFCAIITGTLSVTLLSPGNEMVMIITALTLFALISIAVYICTGRLQPEETKKDIVIPKEDEEEKFLTFAHAFSLTDREQEVLKVLLVSDENVQEIAEQLAISRAALYRHIGNLNEKTQTKSRIGLIQFYYSWKN
ncbi:MAG: helix-turn-helix transcriptional regulator [Butyrivibrio sp.]